MMAAVKAADRTDGYVVHVATTRAISRQLDVKPWRTMGMDGYTRPPMEVNPDNLSLFSPHS